MSAVNDDVAVEYDFASAGTNTFSKGDVLGFSIDPALDINDAIFTMVLIYDVSS